MRISFLKDRKILSGIILIISFSLFFSSCEEGPVFWGKNILPEGDDIETFIDTSVSVNAYNIESPPAITSVNRQMILGSMYDSLFGFSKAEVILPIIPMTNINPGPNLQVDSLRLDLIFDRYIGGPARHTIRLYALSDTLERGKTYTSDFNPEGMYHPDEISSKTFLAENDTIPKDTVSLYIRDPQYITMIENLPPETFLYDSLFIEAFKGLYITTDPVSEGGSMMILDSLLNETRMLLYYQSDSTEARNQDNALYSMGFSYITNKVNIYHHDYTGYRVAENLNDQSSSDSLLFLLGMAGLDARISLSGLEKLRERQGEIIINKAELIIPVETGMGLEESIYPPRLELWTIDDAGNYGWVFDYAIDQQSGKSLFNGIYENFEDKTYIFNITRHIQGYVYGETDATDFVIRPFGGIVLEENRLKAPYTTSQSVHRVVLKSSKATDENIRLVVVYTKL